MKTVIRELQDYSDKLIREGIEAKEYMVKIPVAIFGIIYKSKKEKIEIEKAFNAGFQNGVQFSKKEKTEYKNGHDYFIKKYK